MAMTFTTVLARVAYGLLFAVVLPLLLLAWATLGRDLPLPAVPVPPLAGAVATAIGSWWMVHGCFDIVRRGGGLPMNAFPPPRYVASGIYAWLAHPLYVGFSVAVAGVAAWTESPAGFFVVAPTAAAGCVALVLGYEGPALRARFGTAARGPWLALPPESAAPPEPRHRLAVYLLVLLPWLLFFELVEQVGPARDAIATYFRFERSWPVLEWTYPAYAATYPFVVLAPLAAGRAADLRDFARAGLWATALNGFCYVVLPLAAAPRAFTPTTSLGDALHFEQAMSTGAAAFPSFHVTWACLAAVLYARTWPHRRVLVWLVALAIVASCVTTGMHAIVDVPAGFATFVLVHERRAIWERLRRGSELVANSWREWRVGRVRFIVHGLYAGGAAFVAVLGMGVFLAGTRLAEVALVTGAGIVGAALWAQLIEGGSVSLRPFGYYGSVVGVALAGLGLALGGADPWPILAGLAVFAPLGQAIGRLRCLVQGCCHGHPAAPTIGIRYRHPLSRAVRLAGLADVPLHPTQLYAILWNLPCTALLARLWSVGMPCSFLVGGYLLLAGLGRVAEEGYRGEPQTPKVAGLPIYQWAAVASIVAGAIITVLPSPSPPTPALTLGSIATALAFGAAASITMGVDFPDSDRRFARLVK